MQNSLIDWNNLWPVAMAIDGVTLDVGRFHGVEDLGCLLGCLPLRGQSENKLRGVHIPPSHDPSK